MNMNLDTRTQNIVALVAIVSVFLLNALAR